MKRLILPVYIGSQGSGTLLSNQLVGQIGAAVLDQVLCGVGHGSMERTSFCRAD